eukprot:55228-Eustigmatos_ZCMA.PRE.1
MSSTKLPLQGRMSGPAAASESRISSHYEMRYVLTALGVWDSAICVHFRAPTPSFCLLLCASPPLPLWPAS